MAHWPPWPRRQNAIARVNNPDVTQEGYARVCSPPRRLRGKATYCLAIFTTRSKIAGVNTLPRSCAATRSKMLFHSAFSASVKS